MTDRERLIARLNATPLRGKVLLDVPMARYTSFRIGGPADLLVDAASAAEVQTAIGAATACRVPYYLIGLGTNLLVLDGGIRGLVVRVGPKMAFMEWDDEATAVHAGAGIAVADLASAAGARGYAGLEFAEGIPGTLGGGLVMNAGAYGGEIGEAVAWVEVLSLPGGRGAGRFARRRLRQGELDFGYRHSMLQAGGFAVMSVRLQLQAGDPAAIRARMMDFAARRRERQPLELPSAGSFFVRPAGHFVGPMVEECGLKGYRVGDAEVSRKHANFIVNHGAATAVDVLAVAGYVKYAVRERFGVDLQPEVKIIGEPLTEEKP